MSQTAPSEIILVGAGPACISAAVQLTRCGRKVRILSPEVGGCTRHARSLENLTGFPGGIPGPEFARRLSQQLEQFQISRVNTRVTGLIFQEGRFHIQTENDAMVANTVIVGSGTLPKHLGIPGEEEAVRAKVAVHHPGELNSSSTRQVIIVGGGDVACDYALALAEKEIRVMIMVRGNRFRALESLGKQVFASPFITVHFAADPQSILVDGNGISMQFQVASEPLTKIADALIVAVGRRANLDFLAPALRSGKKGPGKRLFLVGDAAHPHHRQVAIAAGDGMRAAMEISTPFHGEPDEH